jgi:hypothetical protein
MKYKGLLPCLAVAVLVCGCNNQTKLNTARIEALSREIVLLQQSQAQQMAALQSQLASLAPMLDRNNNSYFERNREDALFYHTNTLFLLLTVDRKIESHLQLADTEREAEQTLAYYYHTNQTDTMFFCVAQLEDAMAGQEKRIEDHVSTETRQVSAVLDDALLKQDEAETARQKEITTELAQIQRDLETIKLRTGITNQP